MAVTHIRHGQALPLSIRIAGRQLRDEAGVADGLRRAVAREAAPVLNRELKGKASARGAGKAAGRTRFDIYDVPGGATVSMEAATAGETVEKKYDVAALFFFRIMCRTPYDEYYAYKAVGTGNQKPNGTPPVTKKSYVYRKDPATGKMTLTLKEQLVEHKPDASVARDEWIMTLTNEDGSTCSFMAMDFPRASFERMSGAGWKVVRGVMKRKNGGKNFVSYDMTNMNDHIDVLEYGLYRKALEADRFKESHKGARRYHGSSGGYSVQAPRGIMRITLQEFQNAATVAADEGREMSMDDVGFNASIPDDAGESLRRAMDSMGGFFDEKDIFHALQKGLPHIPMSKSIEKDLRKHFEAERQAAVVKREAELRRRAAEAERRRAEKRRLREKARADRAQAKRQAREERAAARAREREQKRQKEAAEKAVMRLIEKARKRAELNISVKSPKFSGSVKAVRATGVAKAAKEKGGTPQARDKKDAGFNRWTQEAINKSRTEPVLGDLDVMGQGKEEDKVLCKIVNEKFFIDETGHDGWVPLKDYFKVVLGRKLSKAEFVRLINDYFDYW